MAKVETYVKIVRTEEMVRMLADDMINKLKKNLVWKPLALLTGFNCSPIKVRSMAAHDTRDVYFMTKEEYNRWCHGMTYIPIISWSDLGEPSPFRTVSGNPVVLHGGFLASDPGDDPDGEMYGVLDRQGYIYHITQQEGIKVDLANEPDLWVLPKLYRDMDQKIPLSNELKQQIRNLAKTKPVLCKCVAEEFWRVLDGTEDWIYKPLGLKMSSGDYTTYGGFVKMTPEDLEENYIKEDEKMKEEIKKAINSVYGAEAMYGTPTKNGRVYVQRPTNSLKVIEKVIINGDTTIVFFKTNFYPYPAKIVISRQNIEGKNEPRLSLEERVLLACVKRHKDNKQWGYICNTVDLWTTTVDYIAKNNVPAAYLADYRHDINYILYRLPKKNKVLIIQKEPEV